jgi:hypothetical protein
MGTLRAVTLVFALSTMLSPAVAGAEGEGTPPQIAAAHAFLMAWGHEKWDELQPVAAEAVTVKVGDKEYRLEPAAKKSDVVMVFPFRRLSTVRMGDAVKEIVVEDLGLKAGDKEMRGPGIISVKEMDGKFKVTAVSLTSKQ